VNKLSIQAKLILITSILLITGSLISLTMNHRALSGLAASQFESQVALAASALNEQMAGAVRFNKADNIQLAYRTLRKRYPELLSAIIVKNAKGDILLADARKDFHQQQLQDFAATAKSLDAIDTTSLQSGDNNYIVVSMPIRFGDKQQTVGELVSAGRLRARQFHRRGNITFLAAGLGRRSCYRHCIDTAVIERGIANTAAATARCRASFERGPGRSGFAPGNQGQL
jgi:hypothetical protein